MAMMEHGERRALARGKTLHSRNTGCWNHRGPSEPWRTISLLPHDEQEGSLPTIDQRYAEAEPTLERAAEDVTEAKSEIRTLLHSEPGRTWTIRDIQEKLSHWR